MVGKNTQVWLRDDFLSRMISMVMLCSLLLATFTFTLTIAAPDTWSAKAWGDPMITTLDGHTYALNGKGEYVFLNTTDVMIQVRTEYSVANNTDVTGFTAVVVRTVSTTVELYLENTTHISVDVNSSRQTTLLPPVRFPEGMVLQRRNITIINFGTGSLRGSHLQVSASSPKELTIEFTHRGPTSINAHGLAAATTNGSFTMRNGTEVSLNNTKGSIYDFGETWGLFNNESAFNYRLTNKTFHFYNPVNKKRPRFLEELINNLTALFEGQNSSIIQQYNAMCRGMPECLLVIARTGQESEGRRFIQDYDDKKRLEKLKANNPPYFKTTSVSINVTLGETFLMNLSDIVGDDGDFKDLTFSMNQSLTGIEIVTGELRWNVTDLYRNHSLRFELTVTDEFNLTASQLFPVTYCGCRNVSQCDYTLITYTDSDNRFSRTDCKCDETTEGNFCEHVVDPCTKVTCFTNVTCNSSLGLPNPCKTCPPGYTGDGIKCDDIDECLDTQPCSQRCSNSRGSYSCSCNSGYKLLTDGNNCADIDECKYKNTTCTDKTGTTCINIEGSYTCDCDAGFYYDNKKNACIKAPGTHHDMVMVTSSEFDCKSRADGYYPSPYSCSDYYICAVTVGFRTDCHPGLLFNVDSLYCDFPDQVKCQSNSVMQTNPPASNPTPTNPPATNPPPTNPPATNPPNTNAPATNPPITNAPATNAPITNPPATNPPTTKGVSGDAVCQGYTDGFYPDPLDCSFFYLCSIGYAYRERCPSGKMFSMSLTSCDWAANVRDCP